MILLFAVIAGLGASIIRLQLHNHRLFNGKHTRHGDAPKSPSPLKVPPMIGGWLLFIAMLPQLIAFYLPVTSSMIADEFAAVALTVSQLLLLIFGWKNRHQRAFVLLLMGLLFNFIVIVSNGGLMPMSPATLTKLVSADRAAAWQIGERIAHTKDRLLPEEQTRFAFFADRFILPEWTGQAVAYSIGDVVIALGAFWFLWDTSKPRSTGDALP